MPMGRFAFPMVLASASCLRKTAALRSGPRNFRIDLRFTMSPVCLIVQPIHPVGVKRLHDAGLTPRVAASADMDTVAHELADATAMITRRAGLTAAAMEAAARLRVIGSHGIGVDAIAVDRATALGIPVVNTPE